MNKYRSYFCFIIIITTLVCPLEAWNRKRSRKEKSSKQTLNTHMDVNAYTDIVNNKDNNIQGLPRIDVDQLSANATNKKEQESKKVSRKERRQERRNRSKNNHNNSSNATAQARTEAFTTIPIASKKEKQGLPTTHSEEIGSVQYQSPLLAPQQPPLPDITTKPVEMPLTIVEDDESTIELNFENADLQNFVKQIEDIFEITFITDDAIITGQQAKKTIKNNKISFKTTQPLTKKQTWNLFVTFLDIAGFAINPQSDPRIFRISTIENARKAPLPTFIGVDYTTLPDNDELIRYVYFLENASLDTIIEVVNPLRSSSSQGLIALREHKGFIITDKAYNIKMLMSIVKELDKVSIPESMAVLKLRNADAREVANLYRDLLPKEDNSSRFFTKKQPTSLYFPENTRIIADERTNTLILLGPKNAIQKIESFIIKYIDVELDQAYSPLYTYQLKYAESETIADIMSRITQPFDESGSAQFGGVRGVDQYMRPMAFIAEPETNRLIIKGYYEDYLKAVKIIDQLDVRQPQAAIEVLIVSVDLADTRRLGAQIRSKEPGPNGILGNNIKFQTSGLYGSTGIQTRPNAENGAERLLGNLINLVSGAIAGTSLLTLGSDTFGVWGIFEALQLITSVEVVSNPFVLATNNTQATVAIGEQRRIITDTVVNGANEPQLAFDADDAKLEVNITPQINSDGMITLSIAIDINEFTDRNDQTSATQNTRKIQTNAIVANKEVLAIGGLIRNNIQNIETKVPILGDIPILGWFFKNKQKINVKQSLLILISTQIIESNKGSDMKAFTKDHIADYQNTIDYMEPASVNRDPIHRLFFQDKAERAKDSVQELIFERQTKKDATTGKPIEPISDDKFIDQTVIHKVSTLEKEGKKETMKSPQNDLIATINNKKRTELSLTQFLKDKEAKA